MVKSIDVLGIGSAIIDHLSLVNDEALAATKLSKGTMSLIDYSERSRLSNAVTSDSVQSGGSIANSIFHLAGLGSRCQFIGKVAIDTAGDRIVEEFNRAGVKFFTSRIEPEPATGQCFILITPDAQRTMCTYLGASTTLSLKDIDPQAARQVSCQFSEGYLWDSPSARELILEQTKLARRHDTVIAFSLSDPLLVERHRQALTHYVEQDVDVLFANEFEAQALYRTNGFESTINQLRDKVSLLVLTRGAAGSVAIQGDQVYECPADPVANVRDTTGAGDAYAAGFLHGLTRKLSVPQCMSLGSRQAAHVVEKLGGR